MGKGVGHVTLGIDFMVVLYFLFEIEEINGYLPIFNESCDILGVVRVSS